MLIEAEAPALSFSKVIYAVPVVATKLIPVTSAQASKAATAMACSAEDRPVMLQVIVRDASRFHL